MTDSQMLLAAAALLIAAIMLPIPRSVRGIFFVLLGGIYLLRGMGFGLLRLSSLFNSLLGALRRPGRLFHQRVSASMAWLRPAGHGKLCASKRTARPAMQVARR